MSTNRRGDLPPRIDLSAEQVAAIFRGLRDLDQACGKAKQPARAHALICACIDYGLDTRPQIVGALRQLGFDPRFAAITLNHGTGNDPARYHWQRDVFGHYTNLH